MAGSTQGFLTGLSRWASRLAFAGVVAAGLGGAGALAPAEASPAAPRIVATVIGAEALPVQYYGHRGPPPGHWRRGPPPRYYGPRPGYYGPPRGYYGRPPPPPPHWRHRGPPRGYYRY